MISQDQRTGVGGSCSRRCRWPGCAAWLMHPAIRGQGRGRQPVAAAREKRFSHVYQNLVHRSNLHHLASSICMELVIKIKRHLGKPRARERSGGTSNGRAGAGSQSCANRSRRSTPRLAHPQVQNLCPPAHAYATPDASTSHARHGNAISGTARNATRTFRPVLTLLPTLETAALDHCCISRVTICVPCNCNYSRLPCSSLPCPPQPTLPLHHRRPSPCAPTPAPRIDITTLQVQHPPIVADAAVGIHRAPVAAGT